MKGWLVLVLGLLAMLLTSAAQAAQPVTARLQPPVDDVSFPFWCDWGYDWDERCFWDNTSRLSIGGDADKVWRAGVRFSLGAVPPGAEVVSARLDLYFDGTCLAPGPRSVACGGRSFVLDALPIWSQGWFNEREVELGPRVARTVLSGPAAPHWLSWDVTEIVAGWLAGETNGGILVKLGDEQEDFFGGGLRVPSASFADPLVRPRLDLVYAPPG